MDLSDLEVFKAIVEENNFTKAAKKMNYVQSNITTRIKRLETELNTKLFYRHSHGVTLTPSGVTLLKYTDQLFALVAETKKSVSNQETACGPLSIGSIESTAAVRLPPLLNNFMNQFTEVDLSLKTSTTEKLINDILDYQLDGAFVAGPVNHPALCAQPFVEEEVILVSDSNHAVLETFQDINQRTLLTLKPGCIYRKQLETWLEAEGIFPKKIMEFSTLEGLFGCLKAGLGVSLLSKYYVDNLHYKDNLQFYSMPKQYARVSTIFIHRKDVLRTEAFQAFLKEFNLI
ncbi:LysR family transcriptional regulator [Alteribacillus bidgolensis]|uniref:DNA-binding transcriptional regulator, LysR family n=1 Tax=Alteribacillus bidgolensis TaxID=930129 RepID=A0A1G8EBY4_9BACI|nr:LysR family transcriptional regulator [Alteribacillus bidgolensis]SDH67398.1 DNA-binding transcriptional regulator, LysR family [Alteribacillus bidgolensis]